MSSPRVCVIGAGIAGLAAIKECKNVGLDPVCYELNSDLGGVWGSDRNCNTSNTPSVWDNLITNTSKYIITFSDFHPEKDTPPYMTWPDVYEYLCNYAKHFQLTDHIQYDTRVLKVRKTQDHDLSGRWEVFTCPTSEFKGGDKRAGHKVTEEDLSKCHKEVFDVVLVCSGCFKIPQFPKIAGLGSFPGTVRHSFDYRSGLEYEGKKVLVVGNSFSAGDIANDLSLYTKKPVDLAIGRGTWILPRVLPGGVPFGRCTTRHQLYGESEHETNSRIIEECKMRLDHFGSGINPQEPPTRSAYMMGDDIYLKILTDRVRIKDEIVQMKGTSAEYKSGATTDDIDAIIFCTGYSGDMSFIEGVDVSIDRGRMEMYHLMLPMKEKHHTLAFVGFLGGDGAPAQAIELQARYITLLMTGKIPPPTMAAMKRNIDTIKIFSKLRRGRFTYSIPLLQLCDLIAHEIGCYPSFWRVLLRDPVLAFRLWYGPIFTAQFRLLGPDSDWDKARAACYRAHQVLTASPNARGQVHVKRDDLVAARRRQIFRLTCGISVVVIVVGYIGMSRNWFRGLHPLFFENTRTFF